MAQCVQSWIPTSSEMFRKVSLAHEIVFHLCRHHTAEFRSNLQSLRDHHAHLWDISNELMPEPNLDHRFDPKTGAKVAKAQMLEATFMDIAHSSDDEMD